MTQVQAEAAALALKAIAQDWGVRTSVELQSGRGTDPWGVYIKYHRMWHHTVSTYVPGGNLTPCLWLVKVGRPDVIGPLCNGYIGYDRVFRIICMGEANHPGLGGPITIDGVRIPENSARKPTFGIEVEGGIQTWEQIDAKGPDMLEVMGRVDNALAEWSRRPLTSQMEHKTWAPTRKVDRKDFDAARTRGIALTRKWFATAGDDDMTPAECEAVVRKVLNEGTATGTANWADTNKTILSVGRQTYNRVGQVLTEVGKVDDDVVAALTEAIQDAGGTVTGDVVEAAVRRVFADAAVPDA